MLLCGLCSSCGEWGYPLVVVCGFSLPRLLLLHSALYLWCAASHCPAFSCCTASSSCGVRLLIAPPSPVAQRPLLVVCGFSLPCLLLLHSALYLWCAASHRPAFCCCTAPSSCGVRPLIAPPSAVAQHGLQGNQAQQLRLPDSRAQAS